VRQADFLPSELFCVCYLTKFMLIVHKIRTTKLRILKEAAKVPVYMLHHVTHNIKVRGVYAHIWKSPWRWYVQKV